MAARQLTRRRLIRRAGSIGIAALLGCAPQKRAMVTLYTFGDSILDCGRYNELGVHPGQLLVHNDDRLFPEFRGQDLQSHGAARLQHRAQDGATVANLPSQAEGLQVEGDAMVKDRPRAIALITIGGNDLLQGLMRDTAAGIKTFADALDRFVRDLPIRPVLLGNVYDPTLGDDARNFSGVDPAIARANHQRVNAAIAAVANRYGRLVDLHAHFLKGDPSWFTATIEPSLRGASEVRRAFLPHVVG